MKVYMDRNHCTRWQAACESCFGGKIMVPEIDIEGCVMEVIEDDDPTITFYIKDRDGTDKTLVVTEETKPDAYNSWLLLWEKQQEEAKAAQ